MRFSRITVHPEHTSGVPCIRGLRIPVATVVGMVANRMMTDEILVAFPELEAEDIYEALQFAAEAVRSANALSEDESLRREDMAFTKVAKFISPQNS